MAAEAFDVEPSSDRPEVVVATMQRRHLRSVLQIEEQVYPRPWTAGLFLSEIAQREGRTYLVAKVGGRVAGYAGVMYILPDAHITTLAVDPQRQRCSIGSVLLLGLCRDARAKGATALTLEVRVSNEPAQRLYRRFGFVPAGARKAYYPASTGAGPAEDALVMWAHDIDHPAFGARLDEVATTLGVPS